MTKEEYEKLLNSDYWKGYSYSLIKERNFTCEDCGRQFNNERNKLQVHHLVYRDVNPWSYKPEELIVLCEDCHKKRHGIYSEVGQTKYSGIAKDTTTISSSDIEKEFDSSSNQHGHIKKNTTKYAILVALLLLGIWGISNIQISPSVAPTKEEEPRQAPLPEQTISPIKAPSLPPKRTIVPQQGIVIPQTDDYSFANEEIEELPNRSGNNELSTMELIERRQHADMVRRAKRAGVSTEGTTMEILDRIQHADMVRRGKSAGVSTEGTTMEILDRIQHADMVRRAKRAGVSTEGTTMEILDRIHHADMVRRAKRAGVSTEGTTMEILDRIQRKEMEKYNY